MLDRIWAQIACKMSIKKKKKTTFKIRQMTFSSLPVQSGMSRGWRHPKSYYAAVDLRNPNWSFSDSFSTYKVTDNMLDCFPLRWNMTVKYRKLWWVRSIGICYMIHCDKQGVDLCLPRWGQGSEHNGEGQYKQTWQTRSEDIHFTLKIMHITGQNKLLWDYLTSKKSAP